MLQYVHFLVISSITNTIHLTLVLWVFLDIDEPVPINAAVLHTLHSMQALKPHVQNVAKLFAHTVLVLFAAPTAVAKSLKQLN